MKPLRLVPLAAVFVLAACSGAPTEPGAAILPTAVPRFDEPNTMGSGNRHDDGGGETAPQTFGDATAAGDSTGDTRLEPNTMGSGN